MTVSLGSIHGRRKSERPKKHPHATTDGLKVVTALLHDEGGNFQSTDFFGGSGEAGKRYLEVPYRVFLVDVPDGVDVDAVRHALTKRLARVGLDVSTSVSRMEEFYSVESTYLGMFLVLGGLAGAVISALVTRWIEQELSSGDIPDEYYRG